MTIHFNVDEHFTSWMAHPQVFDTVTPWIVRKFNNSESPLLFEILFQYIVVRVYCIVIFPNEAKLGFIQFCGLAIWTTCLVHPPSYNTVNFWMFFFCLISSPNTGMLKCICTNKMNIISFVRLLWKGASYLKAFCPYGNEIFSIHCISNKMYEMWEEKTAWINRQKSNVFSIFAL